MDKEYLDEWVFFCVPTIGIREIDSKMAWPILYSNLLYKMGQHFLDIQYQENSYITFG